MNHEKKEISFNDDIDDTYLYGSIDKLIKYLQNLKMDYIGSKNLHLDFDAGYNNISVSIKGTRLETDEELSQRLASEEAIRMRREEAARKKREKLEKKVGIKKMKDYEEFLRLKGIFEGT